MILLLNSDLPERQKEKNVVRQAANNKMSLNGILSLSLIHASFNLFRIAGVIETCGKIA